MARQPEVQYIRLYTQGSSARQLEMTPPERRKPKTKLPKPRRVKAQVIRLDPLSLCAIMVAAVMLVLIVVGCVELYRAESYSEQLERYVDSLTVENKVLAQTYAEGYDLEEVREIALSLGLVPVEEVTHISISLP